MRMNGNYYEYVGRYLDTYEIKKADVPRTEAKQEAWDTEKDLYLTTYMDGILTDVVPLVGDLLDYPRKIGIAYQEELPKYMQQRYRILSRMKADCDYILGNGGKGAIRYLKNGNINAHISEMKERWNEFPDDEKPEWLTMEQINEYEQKMLAL